MKVAVGTFTSSIAVLSGNGHKGLNVRGLLSVTELCGSVCCLIAYQVAFHICIATNITVPVAEEKIEKSSYRFGLYVF